MNETAETATERTVLEDVGDVEERRGQHVLVHLIGLAEARHLNDEARRHLLQFDVARHEALRES